MITFKQFLYESRSAPLYHGTAIEYLEKILLQREGIQPKTLHSSHKINNITNHKISFKPGAGEDVEVKNYAKGVSLTRNRNFAAWFRGSVILELDQMKLTNNFKIVRFNFFQGRKKPARARTPLKQKFIRSNEEEEFVVTSKNIPIKFITRLWVHHQLRDHKTINEVRQLYGSDFIRIF